jgi:hypothetical protein
MKRNASLIFCLTLILSLLLFSVSCDQDRGNIYRDFYGHRYGMGYGAGCFDDVDSMRQGINPTDEQLKQIADIDSLYRKKYYKNRDNYDKIEQLRIEHREAIEKVLSKSQRDKYNRYYQDRWYGMGLGHRGRGHMGYYYGHGFGMGYGGGCFDNPEVLESELNLSPEQRKQIISIDSQYRSKYYKNRGDYEKIQSLRIEHRKAIENVLTPEQKKRYNNSYNDRWYRRGRRGHMGGPYR